MYSTTTVTVIIYTVIAGYQCISTPATAIITRASSEATVVVLAPDSTGKGNIQFCSQLHRSVSVFQARTTVMLDYCSVFNSQEHKLLTQ